MREEEQEDGVMERGLVWLLLGAEGAGAGVVGGQGAGSLDGGLVDLTLNFPWHQLTGGAQVPRPSGLGTNWPDAVSWIILTFSFKVRQHYFLPRCLYYYMPDCLSLLNNSFNY